MLAEITQGLVAGNTFRKTPSLMDRAGRSLRAAVDGRLDQLPMPGLKEPVNPAAAVQTLPDRSAPVPQSERAQMARPLLFQLNDKHEGGGRYDTLFGHSQRDRFKGVDVSGMTIGEVKAFTDPNGEYGQWVKGELARIGQDPRVATPTGAHQIVGQTLRGASTDMGLTDDTLFDAQTQDRIALHLARQRIAASDTMAGKMAGLRAEWEGYRNVSDADLIAAIQEIEAMPQDATFAGPSGATAQGGWSGNARASATTTPDGTPPFMPVEQVDGVTPTQAQTMPQDAQKGTAPAAAQGEAGYAGGGSQHQPRSLQQAMAGGGADTSPGAPIPSDITPVQTNAAAATPAPRAAAESARAQTDWLRQFFASKGA